MWDSLNDLGQGSLTSSQYCNEFHYILLTPDDPLPQRLFTAWMTLAPVSITANVSFFGNSI